MPDLERVARAYDALAGAYTAKFAGELDGKPLDRLLLDLIASEAAGGRVADLGAGPGHAAAYLAARGARAVAVDLSAEMVAEARRRGLEATVGDLCALPLGDASLAAAVALYAIVHLSPDELRRFAGELARTLAPGAPALLSFHVGAEAVHVDELLGVAVSLDFVFWETAAVVAALEGAGLRVEARLERSPYPTEHPSTRAYLIARRGILATR
jgi:SAM-dependent methyltransferase